MDSPSPNKSSLLPRILTAIALIPVVIGAIAWTGAYPLWALAIVAGAIGSNEAILLISGPLTPGFVGLLLLLITPARGSDAAARQFLFLYAALWLVGVVLVAGYMRKPSPRAQTWATVGGGLWCALPLAMLVLAHRIPGGDDSSFRINNPILLAMLPLWAGDTAAYFVGRAVGKHLFAPKISPKKTWEGAIANLVASVAVAIPVASWVGFGWPVGLGCGFAVGVLGQAGDLFESQLKRQAGVKDSGTLLPGHGGILDRIDSLLFTAPAVAVILAFCTPK